MLICSGCVDLGKGLCKVVMLKYQHIVSYHLVVNTPLASSHQWKKLIPLPGPSKAFRRFYARHVENIYKVDINGHTFTHVYNFMSKFATVNYGKSDVFVESISRYTSVCYTYSQHNYRNLRYRTILKGIGICAHICVFLL